MPNIGGADGPPRAVERLMNDAVEDQRNRLMKKAGNCAFAETFIKTKGDIGYSIRCRVCQHNGVAWSSKRATKVLRQRKTERVDTWELVLTCWVIHMRMHHPEFKQPDWHVPNDADPLLEKSERAFNASGELSEEEKLLRSIFGDP